jgi:2-oxoglutarate ferredoxin oxidoreductase subunit delta
MKLWREPLDSKDQAVPGGVVTILPQRCKGCGFCLEFCPRQVFVLSKKFNAKGYHPPEVADESRCLGCGLCSLICPELAIHVKRKEGDA